MVGEVVGRRWRTTPPAFLLLLPNLSINPSRWLFNLIIIICLPLVLRLTHGPHGRLQYWCDWTCTFNNGSMLEGGRLPSNSGQLRWQFLQHLGSNWSNIIFALAMGVFVPISSSSAFILSGLQSFQVSAVMEGSPVMGGLNAPPLWGAPPSRGVCPALWFRGSVRRNYPISGVS